MIKKSRIVLSNGMPLVIVEVPGAKSLVTSFWTKAGSRADPEDKAGLAHFLEHLLLKKTKNYPSDRMLAEALEKFGAFKNGSTGKDTLCITITSAAKDLALTANVLSEIVFNPLIDKEGFEAEKKIILQEQARKHSLPDELVWEAWFKIFFSPTPLTRPVIGTVSSMDNISQADSIEFWSRYINSRNSILLISGGLKTEDAQRVAQKYFGKNKLGGPRVFPSYEFEGSKRIIVEKRSLPRTNMLLSFRIPGGPISKETYPLLVLKNILSGGWSSRISQRLRVKESLIYGWNSSMKSFLDTGALIFILASADKDFIKMVATLCQELANLREKGITEGELELAKGFMEGSILSSMETSWDYADWYAYDELYWPRNVESVEERIMRIKQVSKEDVEKVAKKYLTQDNWHLAAVGEIEERDIKVDL
jgi:predicted Zn-dependent peptidase